jgi:hypothetical protein
VSAKGGEVPLDTLESQNKESPHYELKG